MVFSLAYTLVRWLIGLVVVLSRRDLSNEIELLVLRHENVCGAKTYRRALMGVTGSVPNRTSAPRGAGVRESADSVPVAAGG
jgi:hypothetical protein